MATIPASEYKATPVHDLARQSKPVDPYSPYDISQLAGKVAVITGGASGFGAAFARRWASNGATVIIADVNDKLGAETTASICNSTGRADAAHFIHCDVSNWLSQVELFKKAVAVSPHGGIDIVVANAGIATPDTFHEPKDLDGPNPSPPDLRVIDINLVGVLYTAQLALYWLQRNPGSEVVQPDTTTPSKRDRHLLLIGSLAGALPFPMQPIYATAKHGVTGLFRSLRSTSFVAGGIRVNMLCPYFIDTPIFPGAARLIMAGTGLGTPEDVEEAGTRLAADQAIVGRALAVGPRMNVVQNDKGEWENVIKPEKVPGVQDHAIWEMYADDWEDSEEWSRTFLRLLNGVIKIRGWGLYLSTAFQAVVYGFTKTWTGAKAPAKKTQ